MRLHLIPGAYVYGFFGSFGAGKTLYLVEQGLEFAEYHRKTIAANFYLNENVIRQYGYKFKKPWLTFCRIKHSLSFDELLQQKNCILLLDEAGVDLFSRSWKDRKKQELDALFRIRHYRNKLIYVAQDWNQVDIQFRRNTHLCVWIRGFQHFPRFSDPVLISRLCLFYSKPRFENFISDPFNTVKIFYPIVQTGFRFMFDVIKLKPKFKFLFNCYNSFDEHRTRQTSNHVHKYIEFDETFKSVDFSDVKFNSNFDLDDLL